MSSGMMEYQNPLPPPNVSPHPVLETQSMGKAIESHPQAQSVKKPVQPPIPGTPKPAGSRTGNHGNTPNILRSGRFFRAPVKPDL